MKTLSVSFSLQAVIFFSFAMVEETSCATKVRGLEQPKATASVNNTCAPLPLCLLQTKGSESLEGTTVATARQC